MISFYPGPSQLDPGIDKYLQQAVSSGILSVNHRSKEFVELSKSTIAAVKSKLDIPEDYVVLYISSATECWEVISQSLVKNKSLHLFNGAFGQKWMEYAQKIKPASGIAFGIEEPLPVHKLNKESAEVICLTHNETSNATQVSNELLQQIRNEYADSLIAIDATSSMAGVKLDFTLADVWFASVQKCFGLPAGMALLILSPKAIAKTKEVNERGHYNSLLFQLEKMQDWQTTHTPNVLAIFLLKEVMENRADIGRIHSILFERAQSWYQFLDKLKGVHVLIKNPEVRSETVIAIEAGPDIISKVKQAAFEKGLLLGNGYGTWAKNTFRIANFPALTEEHIGQLKKFLIEELGI
ncbi:MAG TPA: aminotransferase class V-fold PLP-dependent enzyme [Cytophagaceae bacterium]